MKPEYDFSKAVRGKFFHKGAELRLPIYLDAKLPTRVERFVLQCFFPLVGYAYLKKNKKFFENNEKWFNIWMFDCIGGFILFASI